MSVDMLYQVELTDEALFVYLNVRPTSEARALDHALSLLETFPRLGRRYEPLYEAARLPFDLYVLHASHHGIYYELDEEARRVIVLFIESDRRNPSDRFSDTRGFYGR